MKVQRWHFVYQTLNLIENKVYVGSHTSLVDPDLKFDGYLGSGSQIRSDINRLGRDNFKRTILKQFNSKEEAMQYEAFLVTDEFVRSANACNVNKGRSGCVGHTEEAKAQMSVDRVGAGNSMYGKNHTEKSRKRMSRSHKGKVLSLETRLKMGKARTGECNGMYGVVRDKSECPQCGKSVDVANMKRWHGDKCRQAVN